MRYWLRKHPQPAGKISLLLRVGSGSLNEDDDQRGAAHLLEHMAFNGSKHFAPGTLIKRFEGVGLTFGAHQNATTGFKDTTYRLTIPNTAEALELALLNFSDIAYRLNLDPSEIDKERGVVLAERRARDSAAARAFNKQIHALVPGSRFATRLPIGDEQVMRTIAPARVRDYYEKWYRPDNTVLMVAGDLDPALLENLVRKHFSGWSARTRPAADADPDIAPYRDHRAAVFAEEGLVNADIDIARLEPPAVVRTVGDYRQWLVHALGKRMLNSRLREQVLDGQAPYVSAWVSSDSSFGATLVEARAKGDPKAWRTILQGLIVEIKRARTHGFTAAEFTQATKVLLADFEKDTLSDALSAIRWLRLMDDAVEHGRKPLAPRQEFDLVKRLVATISRAEIEEAVRVRFAPGAQMVTLALPDRDGLDVPSAAAVVKLVADAEAMDVARVEERERPQALLARDPSPGKIVQQSFDRDLDVVSATLANGVRVHARPMNFQKDYVNVRIVLAGGRVKETAANNGISEAAALPFQMPTTHSLTATDVKRLLAAKHVTVSGRDTPGGIELDIEGHRKDVEDGFRLAYLLLTQAKIDKHAFDLWQRQASDREANLEGSVSAQLNQEVNSISTGNDPRFSALRPADAKRLSREQAQAWLDQLLKSAPMEVAIVGDIPKDEALGLAAKYLGALAPRRATAGAYANVRTLSAAPGPHQSVVKVDTATPKAMVYVGWRGPDWQNVHDWHVLDMAGRILTSRLMAEIREKRGLVYSIQARSTANSLYRGNGRFRVSFVVDPAQANEVADAVEQLVDEFVERGPTPEELAIAREQAGNSFRTGSGNPAFWLDILSDLEYMQSDLNWVKHYLQNIMRYTGDEMVTVMKKYIRPQGLVRVIGAPADSPLPIAAPPKTTARVN